MRAIFDACGRTDEVEQEAHIECFTAMTGPVPGFVAFYAKAMVDYATAQGIAPEIADRAVKPPDLHIHVHGLCIVRACFVTHNFFSKSAY